MTAIVMMMIMMTTITARRGHKLMMMMVRIMTFINISLIYNSQLQSLYLLSVYENLRILLLYFLIINIFFCNYTLHAFFHFPENYIQKISFWQVGEPVFQNVFKSKVFYDAFLNPWLTIQDLNKEKDLTQQFLTTSLTF